MSRAASIWIWRRAERLAADLRVALMVARDGRAVLTARRPLSISGPGPPRPAKDHGATQMTYVVTEACIMQVHGLRRGLPGRLPMSANMLVIHPDECIDCGVCEPNARSMPSRPTAKPHGTMGGGQPRIRPAMAQHHPQGRGLMTPMNGRASPTSLPSTSTRLREKYDFAVAYCNFFGSCLAMGAPGARPPAPGA
jgi:NAD-dependent dihydropyrimidine dehydrogenase PreA subunit